MPLIQWNAGYSVGVASLDGQHQQLIGILNELHEAMAAAKADSVLTEIVTRLGSYARMHLDTEERLLKTNSYPEFAQHKAQHDAYVSKVQAFQSELGSRRVAVTVELLQFLKKWWMDHILGTDRRYTEFLNQRGVR